MNILISCIIVIISLSIIMVLKSVNGEQVPWCSGAPNDQVYLFDSWDFNGDRYVYNVSQGKLKLPEKFKNNVQSFTSGSNICFINCNDSNENNQSSIEHYQITTGQSHRNYAALTNFGQRMDTIVPGNCTDAINSSPCTN